MPSACNVINGQRKKTINGSLRIYNSNVSRSEIVIHFRLNPKKSSENKNTLIFIKAFCVFVSGWQDSNLRPPAPKAGAIPGYATSRTWYRSFFNPVLKVDKLFVGMAGFEPTTSCSQSRRDTGLRYIPNLVSSFLFPFFEGIAK